MKDLLTVYKNYKWPLMHKLELDETVKFLMEKFGQKTKGKLEFIEFCGLMEYLWSLKS